MLKQEPEGTSFVALIADDPEVRISAANYVEAGVVLDRAGPVASRGLDEFIKDAQISIEPVSARQAELARQAYRDFGKGSGHPAGLNFGDCFAYALAVESGEPLLFKGDDFAHTGIAAAYDGQA